MLLPLTRYRWGASIVGVFGALPAYLGAAWLIGEKAIAGIIPAVVVGGAVGYILWFPPGQAGVFLGGAFVANTVHFGFLVDDCLDGCGGLNLGLLVLYPLLWIGGLVAALVHRPRSQSSG